jgi:hypothetical protein
VGTHLDQHLLGRRIVAIVAAYAIVLSTVIASFAAARTAADAFGDPLGVICHSENAGVASPLGDDNSPRRCTDDCCTGCLPLTALLPTPVVLRMAPLPIVAARPFARAVFGGRLDCKSHRSRAPPQTV